MVPIPASHRTPAPADGTPPTLVVGVGASAGGLGACQGLLQGAPADQGLALIVVLHLAPAEESHVTAILQKATSAAAMGPARLERKRGVGPNERPQTTRLIEKVVLDRFTSPCVVVDRKIEETQETREELRTAVEQLRTATEEHGARYEELLSLNEEFQSSNEEIEASKEELQSLNEELTPSTGSSRSETRSYAHSARTSTTCW